MRIAQVAPLYEAAPPRLYGGTELIVAHLTDVLVELGHEVTLFASADAQTRAEFVPVRQRSSFLGANRAHPGNVGFIVANRISAF